MNKIKLSIKNQNDSLTWMIVTDTLILKNRETNVFSIPLSLIETIKVERSVNHKSPSQFELVIEGGCKILSSIILSRKNAFRTQKWLESNIYKARIRQREIKTNGEYHRYRPHLFRKDFLDTFLHVIAYICIVVLLLYIAYMYPRLSQNQKNQQENQLSYEFLFQEGMKLVELDRLTDGINKLEDAQSLKNTEEVQKAINSAYLERAQFYFDAKEFEKAKRDILQMKIRPSSVEKMLDLIESYGNTSPYFNKINLNQIEKLLGNPWNMPFKKENETEKTKIKWVAKKYDTENGIILNCTITGASIDKIESIVLMSEMMQKDLKENGNNFEVISKEFLGLCTKIPFSIENLGAIEVWFNKWYPKMASSNYQFKEQISGILFQLMGTKGVRVVEIRMAEVTKTP